MKKALMTGALALFIGSFGLMVNAETPEEKGLAIAKEQQKRDEGWGDSQSEMKMVLRSASGSENVRMIKIKSLEVTTDGDKSLMVFDEPKDVQGTSFLSFSHVNGPDDQWIYLPALKRVKRIASNKKSGSFMGSEFSYEDLSSFEPEKYSFKYLRDETLNGEKCFVVESVPKDANSGYSKLVTWVDQSEYRMQKVEFYDKKQALLKIMTVSDYSKLENKHWRPKLSRIENKQTGKSTDLHWMNIRLKTGLKDSDFSENNLKKAD